MNIDFSTKPVITLSLYFPRQISHIRGIHFTFGKGRTLSIKKLRRWLDQPFVYHTRFEQIRFFYCPLDQAPTAPGFLLVWGMAFALQCTVVLNKTRSKACWELKWKYFFPWEKPSVLCCVVLSRKCHLLLKNCSYFSIKANLFSSSLVCRHLLYFFLVFS